MRGVELDEPVARRAGEADGSLDERAVEGGEDRLRVVAVGGVGRGDRVGGDEDRMAGRVVDGRRVGAAVARAAAAVAVDGRVEADVQPAGRGPGLSGCEARPASARVFRPGSVT